MSSSWPGLAIGVTVAPLFVPLSFVYSEMTPLPWREKICSGVPKLKGGSAVPLQPPIVLKTTTSPAAAQRLIGR